MIRLIGAGVALVGLILFAFAVSRSWSTMSSHLATPGFVMGLGKATLCIFASLLVAAFSWRMLLSPFATPPPGLQIEAIYTSTQIGKYLPGNVGQLLGRAAVLKTYGVPIAASTKAVALEIGLVLVVGLAMVTLSSHELLIGIVQQAAASAKLGFFLPLLAFVIGVAVAVTVYKFGRDSVAQSIRNVVDQLRVARSNVAAAALLTVLTFVLNGIALKLCANAVGFPASLGVGESVTIASAAFIAGFVTPGAPGGIGVREAITVVLLTGKLGEPAAVMVALMIRLAAILTDLLGFLFGAAWLAAQAKFKQGA